MYWKLSISVALKIKTYFLIVANDLLLEIGYTCANCAMYFERYQAVIALWGACVWITLLQRTDLNQVPVGFLYKSPL
jgi:hypothetical protein